MNFKDYCENVLNESKESRDLMRKMNLVYVGYGIYKDRQGNKYEYDPRIKQMKKLSLDTKLKYSDKIIDKIQGKEAKNNKDKAEVTVNHHWKDRDKMIKVTGNTYQARELLKQAGFKWDQQQKAFFWR